MWEWVFMYICLPHEWNVHPSRGSCGLSVMFCYVSLLCWRLSIQAIVSGICKVLSCNITLTKTMLTMILHLPDRRARLRQAKQTHMRPLSLDVLSVSNSYISNILHCDLRHFAGFPETISQRLYVTSEYKDVAAKIHYSVAVGQDSHIIPPYSLMASYYNALRRLVSH